MTFDHLAFGIWITCEMTNDYESFDQMSHNPKNGQMTMSFPNTEIINTQIQTKLKIKNKCIERNYSASNDFQFMQFWVIR
jgi:hypothetical protein